MPSPCVPENWRVKPSCFELRRRDPWSLHLKVFSEQRHGVIDDSYCFQRYSTEEGLCREQAGYTKLDSILIRSTTLAFCTFQGILGLFCVASSFAHTNDISEMLGIGSPKPSLSFAIRIEYAFFTIAVFFVRSIIRVVAVYHSLIVFS